MDQTKDEEVINDKDLDHPRRPKQKAKAREIIVAIFLVIAVAISTSFTGVALIYAYYYETFYVNGQSMYPTLNKDAERKGMGKLGETHGGSYAGDWGIDLGIMDCHKLAINRIKRFDIVILKYDKEDDTKYIKRIIGLPGERIQFKEKGKLYVCKKGQSDYEYIEQPVNKQMVEKGIYPTGPISIDENEIYVVGDNRTHSDDSRAQNRGPLSINLVVGVAVAIIGTCELKTNTSKNPESEYDTINVHYHWPRYI